MTSVFVFISGAVLLIFSAEKLVGYLAGAARGLRISAFLLAVVFTGIEFDDIALGLTFNAGELNDVALGIVFGTAISFSGVVLALGALIAPSRIRIPRDYVILFAVAPLVLLAITLTGPLTVVDGAILLALFLAFLAYVAVRESRRTTPTFRNAEVYEAAIASSAGGGPPVREAERHVREAESEGAAPGSGADGDRYSREETSLLAERRIPGWATLGLAVLALAGLIVGAETTSLGTEGILQAYGLDGTVFGATLATLVLTIEDIFLTVEPIRKGVPEIGIGNVIGSLVFSVTGKLGITLLAGDIVVGSDALRWHLPALIVMTAIAAGVLYTGRLRRWHGAGLLGLYVAYWVVSFAVFGGAPVDVD